MRHGHKDWKFLKRHWMLVAGIAVATGVAVGLGLVIKETVRDTNDKSKNTVGE